MPRRRSRLTGGASSRLTGEREKRREERVGGEEEGEEGGTRPVRAARGGAIPTCAGRAVGVGAVAGVDAERG